MDNININGQVPPEYAQNEVQQEYEATLQFGKYKGRLITDIIREDPPIIRYYLGNVDWFELSPENMEALAKAEKNYVKPPMRLTDNVYFGKYKGKTLQSVIELDVQYIGWIMKKWNDFRISDEAMALLNKFSSTQEVNKRIEQGRNYDRAIPKPNSYTPHTVPTPPPAATTEGKDELPF